MEDKISTILKALRESLEEILQDRIEEIYLYGSHARGEAKPDSDIDILIVIDHIPGYLALLEEIAPVVTELSLKYDVVISPAFISKQRFDQENIPFVINLKREAIAI